MSTPQTYPLHPQKESCHTQQDAFNFNPAERCPAAAHPVQLRVHSRSSSRNRVSCVLPTPQKRTSQTTSCTGVVSVVTEGPRIEMCYLTRRDRLPINHWQKAASTQVLTCAANVATRTFLSLRCWKAVYVFQSLECWHGPPEWRCKMLHRQDSIRKRKEWRG